MGRGDDHPDLGPALVDLLRQFKTVHTRGHVHIREYRLHVLSAKLQALEGSRGIARFDHLEACLS